MNEIEKYIASFPGNIQLKLNNIRNCVLELAPTATERICMRIPTYDLNSKRLVHFAAFNKHIGFYPQPEAIVTFKDKLKAYKTTKGAIQFPLDSELPIDLIREIIKYRVAQVTKIK